MADPPSLRIDARADRIANITVVVAPVVIVVLAATQVWGSVLGWSDLVVAAIMYALCGAGVTVGFHRLLTHRAFQTHAWLRFVFSALGSAAVEGPVIEWVAYHRRHHAFADEEGDPHSPHVGHGSGFAGALRGLFHAHVGWVMFSTEPADEQRYAPDLMKDRAVRFVDRTFVLWVLGGLAVPFGLGVALTGTIHGGLTGLLWGGAVRILALHHATFSINSLCHFFGRRRFETDDESTNLRWLALLTFGESWHNNHHAFPTSAEHGMRRGEWDISALIIRALERVGLAWDVVRVDPATQAAKALALREQRALETAA
jgi:stearoyl-CoA desaturase (delta-9 desaturase)